MKKMAAWLLIILMIVLHQDFWLWGDNRLFMGFIPSGLAYHAAYSIAAAIVMGLLVQLVWPRELEEFEHTPDDRSAGGH